MKVYLAGPLFNEAEIKQRQYEGQQLQKMFPFLDIFNPIDQPFNTNKQTLPTPIDIYEADTQQVIDCDIFIADLTNSDAGVMMELGIAIMSNTPIIIGVNSDIRLISANQYDIPSYSMNHYILGGLLKHGHLVTNFDDAVKKLNSLI